MITVTPLEFEGKILLGLRVEFQNAPLLILFYRELAICCGYINVDVMDKFGNAVCIVRGVRNFEELISAEIVEVTSKAIELGAKKGLKVCDLLRTLA